MCKSLRKKSRTRVRKTTYDKTASALSNKLPTATISRLFISAGSHWSSTELYPRNNSTTESYGARSVFRFQFCSLIKALEKFKRYRKRQVIYIAFSSNLENPDKLGFSRRENTAVPGFCIILKPNKDA